jgi:hypothetical protein
LRSIANLAAAASGKAARRTDGALMPQEIIVLILVLTGLPEVVWAQEQPTAPISNVSEGTTKSATKANITFSGYVEVFYQWNFNDPSNKITNYRGFDNWHDSFTLDNVVLDVLGSAGSVSAHFAFQYGHTPQTYYLAEPSHPGTPGTGPSNSSVWNFLQQANLGWKAPVGPHGLLIEGGLFLSPIGPEGMAVKDQWNWSRSDLFFALPFYHTGVRATYAFTDRISGTLAAYNGWNSVVDNNEEKSLSLQFTYNIADHLTYQFLYFGGIERPPGSPEGRPWRNLFDTYLAWYPRTWLSFVAHADAGFEPNNFGTSGWAAGALYGRVRARPWLYLAARADVLWENVPGMAAPIFFPVPWVSSQTLTFDTRPADNFSVRLEYRHDQAEGPLYFKDTVAADATGAFVPTANGQDTITFGMVAWF